MLGLLDSLTDAGSRTRRALHAPLLAALLAATGCQVQRPAAGGEVTGEYPQAPAYAQASSPASAASAGLPSSGANAWLAQHPNVAATVVWETERGAIPWAYWDQAMKGALEEAFTAEVAALQGRGNPLGFPLADPPPNISAPGSRAQTVLAPRDAFRLYVAHVGHSLALEATRFVPWSIERDTPESLRALLDGRSMFAYHGELGGYLLDPLRSGFVLPAPPAVELGFLAREHLLGQTKLETIERMVFWARQLRHFSGRMEHDNAERIWQYRGMPPVSRVLAGTGGTHFTAGCWGTTGLFIAVLRAANVPVRLINIRAPRGSGPGCSHAQPYFISEGRFLSHGDDPYSQHLLTLDVSVPANRILLDTPTWSSWFGEGVDPAARCANVGRGVTEIALETLPGYLVKAYCEDSRSGVTHRASKVAHAFAVESPGTAFPLSRLESSRLWERLEDKARRTGACTRLAGPPATNVPSPASLPAPGAYSGEDE